jgi:hypothetical protein
MDNDIYSDVIEIFDVACYAKAHLDHARELQKSLPPNGYLPLLPAVSRFFSLSFVFSFHFHIYHLPFSSLLLFLLSFLSF